MVYPWLDSPGTYRAAKSEVLRLRVESLGKPSRPIQYNLRDHKDTPRCFDFCAQYQHAERGEENVMGLPKRDDSNRRHGILSAWHIGVNMPLLYGEGDRAFQRLQEELIKETSDQTIFGWQGDGFHYGVFAKSPVDFEDFDNLTPIPSIPSIVETPPYSMTNRGLHIQASLISLPERRFAAILECHVALDYSGRLGIPLLSTTNPTRFVRDSSSKPEMYTHKEIRKAELRTIYIQKSRTDLNEPIYQYPCRVQAKSILPHGYTLRGVAPSRYPFNWSTVTMGLLKGRDGKHLSFRRQLHAAFEFTISIWRGGSVLDPPEGSPPRSLVVAVTIDADRYDDETATASAYIFIKPSDMCLEHWLKRYKTGEFIPGDRGGCEVASTKADRKGFKVKVGVDVGRETIFNQNIVINVRC